MAGRCSGILLAQTTTRNKETKFQDKFNETIFNTIEPAIFYY